MEKNLAYSLEEKDDFVRAILENSVFSDREYYGLITEVLMQIPVEALEKIDALLDHIVVMRKSDYATAENVHFTCRAKHEIHLMKNAVKGDKSEPEPVQSEVVKPVYFEKYVVIFGLENMKNLTQAQKVAIIAEEFGHVYLKHDCVEGSEKDDAVARLIESWGFRPLMRPRFGKGQKRTTALVRTHDFEG